MKTDLKTKMIISSFWKSKACFANKKYKTFHLDWKIDGLMNGRMDELMEDWDTV